MNAGCAMNPSMDFCARWGKTKWFSDSLAILLQELPCLSKYWTHPSVFLFRALAAAWSGSSVPFSTSSPYWLIPLILPPLGGTLGVGLHWVVNRHLPKLE